MTYCNARLSQALIVSGSRMHLADVVDGGLRSLEWLVSVQLSPEGDFTPIGSNGFLARGGAAAAFDQLWLGLARYWRKKAEREAEAAAPAKA